MRRLDRWVEVPSQDGQENFTTFVVGERL
jgi:hypothetical protein